MNILEILQKVNDGQMSAIDAYTQFKLQSEIIENAINAVKKLAYDEVEATGEKDYKKNGFVYNCQIKTTYDFNHIKAWSEVKKSLSDIEDKAKAAMKFKLDANSETGDVIEPATAKYSYYVKIRKA
jgi:hypothetical protein